MEAESWVQLSHGFTGTHLLFLNGTCASFILFSMKRCTIRNQSFKNYLFYGTTPIMRLSPNQLHQQNRWYPPHPCPIDLPLSKCVAIFLSWCAYCCWWWCSVMSDSVTPWTLTHQNLLFMGFPRQEYGSRLPFPLPGHLPNPGIEPSSPVAPALAARFFTTEPPGKPCLLVLPPKWWAPWRQGLLLFLFALISLTLNVRCSS